MTTKPWYEQAQRARSERLTRAIGLKRELDTTPHVLIDEADRLWRILSWEMSGLIMSGGYVLLECIEVPKLRERPPLRGGEPGKGPPTRGMTGVELMLALESGDWRRTRCW